MSQLPSERVVVAAPVSFAGSSTRIWKITHGSHGWTLAAMGTLAVTLITLAWLLVAVWYVLFGLFLIPYRLVRRGQRKRKRQELQHRELLAATRQPPRP